MGKKSLTKSTTKKKSTKKGGKKKAINASAIETTAKTPTVKSLLKRQFDAWKPESLYRPEPDAAYEQNFAAPPAIESEGKAAGQIRDILSRRFDLSAPKEKKAAPRKTAPKKAEAKKAEKKAPKKEAAPAAKKTDKKKEAAEAQKKAAPRKPATIKELIEMKFDAWQPKTLYSPEPDTEYEKNFAAPPAFEAMDRAILFKQFDLSIPETPTEKKPVAPVATPEKPPVAEPVQAAAEEKAPKKAAPKKEPVPLGILLKKQFDSWTPAKLYAPAADAEYEKNFAAPPAFEAANKSILFKQFDLSVTETPAEMTAAPEEPTVAEPAEAAAPEPEPVEEAAPEIPAEEAAPEPETISAEPAAAEVPAVETAAPPAEEAIPAQQPAGETVEGPTEKELAEPAAEEVTVPEIEPVKEAAGIAEAPPAEEPKAAEETAPETIEPEPEKEALQPPEPPEPEYPDWGGDDGGDEPPKPPVYRKPPMNPALTLLIAVLGVIFAIIIASSISNMQNYFVKTSDDAVEIWQGNFSPRGSHLVATLPGAEAPAETKDVYSRKEAMSMAFRYYMNQADVLPEAKGDMVDFDPIRQHLKAARKYAVTLAQKKTVSQRLSRIDYMVLMFKADVAAETRTAAGYENALEYLNQAKKLDIDRTQTQRVNKKIEAVRAAKDALKAEEKIVAPPGAKTPHSPAAKTRAGENGQAEESEKTVEPEGTSAPSEPETDAGSGKQAAPNPH